MKYCTPDYRVRDGKVEALMLTVARRAGADCTNGGITSEAEYIFMACDGGNHLVDVDDPHLFKLDINRIGKNRHPRLLPFKEVGEKVAGPMFGGNHAFSSDARLHEVLTFALLSEADAWLIGALPVHDRVETWEQYEVLSR